MSFNSGRLLILLTLLAGSTLTSPTSHAQTPAAAPAAPRLAAFSAPRVYVDAAATGQGSGESWANACTTINQAIALARQVGVSEIWVAQGTYHEAIIPLNAQHLLGGFASGATQLTNRDSQAHPTVIDASKARGGSPAYHVVSMNGLANIELTGFTITGGRAIVSSDPYSEILDNNLGSGIYCKNLTGDCRISDCLVLGNNNYVCGGGLYSFNSSLTVSKCVFRENRAYLGGGVYVEDGTTQFTDCSISANSGEASAGLQVTLYNSSASTKLHQCQIVANHGDHSGRIENTLAVGGAYLLGPSTSHIELANCLIAGNDGDGAGGILVNSGAATLVHCTIVNNNSQLGLGGGLLCYGSGRAQCLNSVFSGNQPYSVYELSYAGTAVVDTCLFSSDSTAKGDFCNDGTQSLRGAAAINTLFTSTNAIDGPPQFVMSPHMTWTAASTHDYATGRTTYTDAKAHWSPGKLKGQLVQPDLNQRWLGIILDNTTTTLVAIGLPFGSAVSAGTKWQFADFRPGANSPAIDRGASLALDAQAVDLLGNARPTDIPDLGGDSGITPYDLGAYEAAPDAPRLRLTPDSDPLDFGTVDIIDGPTPPRSVTITNAGFKPLLFTPPGIVLTGDTGDFTTTTATATTPLNPGATRTVSLTFDPVTTGSKTAQLLISTNDADRPLTTVTLTGNGIIPPPVFSKNPLSRTADPGTSVTFSISATSRRTPLIYQWLLNGRQINDSTRTFGAQTTTLTLTHLTQKDRGTYSCMVTTPVNSAESSGAWLLVNPIIHVVSPYGLTTPPQGDSICRVTFLTIKMNTPIVDGPPGVRHVCTGWSVSKYTSGGGSPLEASLYLDSDTTITWNWKTQYLLQTQASPGGFGTVTPAPAWYDAGQSVSVTEQPAPIYLFNNWTGDASGTASSLSIVMDAPKTLTANFALRPPTTGSVDLNVWPKSTVWALRDSKGVLHRGTGKAHLVDIPIGSFTLFWTPPAGYDAPAVNPVLRNLPAGAELSITEVLESTSDAKARQAGAILRYLLGLTTDSTGLDLNSDGKVTAADLLQAKK